MRGFPEAMTAALRSGYSPYPNMPCVRLIEGDSVAHCHDLAEIDNPVARRGGVALAGIRTILYVALRKDGGLLGQIVAARREVRPFSDKEIALVENFAAQAVIAMENARLINETREALEQQTATAEVLGVINSSPGDLAPVFDAMLDKAIRLCRADQGNIFSLQDGAYRMAGSQGLSDEYRDIEAEQSIRPGRETLVGRAALLGRSVQIADALADPDYGPKEDARVGSVRTMLGVPLLRDGVPVGVFALGRTRVEAFTDKEVDLVTAFAAQAVIAMENARLLGELHERTDDLQESLEFQTATSEVLQVISRSTFDLDTILQTVVSSAHRLCRADQAVIFRNAGGEYRWAAGHAMSPGSADSERNAVILPGRGTLIGRAALECRAVQIEDAWADSEYAIKDDARAAGTRSMLGVPLLRDGAPIGAIGLARNRVEPFSEREVQLVATFADQAAIAIENARLITETREALEQQTATAEVLGVINASPGDLAPVFDAILEKAHSLCGAAKGALVIHDGDKFRGVAMRGLSEPFATIIQEQRDNPPGSPPMRLLAGEPFVQIIDCRDEKLPIPRAAFELEGVRTIAFVPLRKDAALLGYITVYRQEVRLFSDKQIALLQNFAAQAVIAME
ncbi:MAG TPA: GAF domain-containing protein, partial [Xanthobacteraceae bacterium]|nr:GAF domain-containing protein [Xanthobacteraceae bacterium]